MRTTHHSRELPAFAPNPGKQNPCLATLILLLIIAVIPATFTHATTKVAVANIGNGWSVAGNWLPAGVPGNGDTAYIPLGFTLKVKGNIYASPTPNIVIKVVGVLDFEPSGKLDLGPGSAVMVMGSGSILSNGTGSEIISIGGVTKFSGNGDGTITGPAFANAGTGSSPFGFSPGALAIALESFKATRVGSGVFLAWKASSNDPHDRFVLQRSADNQQWQNITSLPVAALLHETVSYDFTDRNPVGKTIFYRLVLENQDGKTGYSPTVAVHLYETTLKVFPNPARSVVRVGWEYDRPSGNVSVEIRDLFNRVLSRRSVAAENRFIEIDIAQIPAGNYRVSVMDGHTKERTALLVIGH